MVGLALTMLVSGLLAAPLGFGGMAGFAAGLYKVISVVFLVSSLVSFTILGARRA